MQKNYGQITALYNNFQKKRRSSQGNSYAFFRLLIVLFNKKMDKKHIGGTKATKDKKNSEQWRKN